MSSASAKAFDPTRSESAKGHEPSMEEILASIRRIISDDQSAGRVPAWTTPPMEQHAPDEDDDVLDLADIDRETMTPAPVAPEDDEIGFRDMEADIAPAAMPEPEVEPPSPVTTAAWPAPEEPRPEISEQMREAPPPVEERRTRPPWPPRGEPREAAPPRPAMAAALDQAVEDRLLSPATDVSVTSAFNSLATTILANNSRTLEDVVGEMLKPMLKAWLDDNLPVVVERLVRAEIERVARGGRP